MADNKFYDRMLSHGLARVSEAAALASVTSLFLLAFPHNV